MNLNTQYLGLTLQNPLVPSASPLSEEIDNIRRMEDSGASAVVLHSLFEEQFTLECFELHHHLTSHTDSFAEAQSFFPEPDQFIFGPAEYLEHIRRAKEAVDIPIIASLNGHSPGGWTDFARQMEEAGADAIELNIYTIPTDPDLSSDSIEASNIEIVSSVKSVTTLPVAVKLSPFFTNLASMARRLDDAGANGLVLFNRFYQPDIDLENLDVKAGVLLSTPMALRLPLTWIGILHGRIKADLAATSGIHTARQVIKLLMVGANVTMLCATLMKHGIGHLREIRREMQEWMEENEYESVAQMQGSMSQKNCPDPSAYERVQYIRDIHITGPIELRQSLGGRVG